MKKPSLTKNGNTLKKSKKKSTTTPHGQTVRVLAFGSFDGFHPGHAHYLSQAKKLGDELIVIVARDTTIKKIKGHIPRHNEEERLTFVSKSTFVTKAVLGYQDNYFKVLDDFKPTIIALGYDQQTFSKDIRHELISRGLRTKIVRLRPFHPEVYKSSKLHL